MSRIAMWQRLDRPALECVQWTVGRELVLRGDVVGDIHGLLGRVAYRVRVGGDLLTRAARIHLWSDSANRHLHLSRNQEGRWQANGLDRPDLADATDIDIGVTPATNSLLFADFDWRWEHRAI